jgi:hypothetical protein
MLGCLGNDIASCEITQVLHLYTQGFLENLVYLCMSRGFNVAENIAPAFLSMCGSSCMNGMQRIWIVL